MSSLINVPTLIFDQEDHAPIIVHFYNGSIDLVQDGNSVSINPEEIKRLLKAIISNKDRAQELLDKRI